MSYYVNEIVVQSGDGSENSPFKTFDEVFKTLQTTVEQKIDYKIFTNSPEGYKEVSKAQIKKLKKNYLTKPSKIIKEETSLMEEKFENIVLDDSLQPAGYCHINKLSQNIGKRFLFKGRVQHLRKQSKKLWFLTLRDGTDYLQCVLEDKLCKTKEASQLQRECSLAIYGTVRELPTDNKTVGGIELIADYWELIGGVEIAGGIESIVNADSEPDVQFNNRHLMIRGENTSKVILMKSFASRAFRKFYEDNGYSEIFPPTLVQNQCEGGSTLFKFDYFGEEAYLSQSSQLYLESAVSSFKKCYSITRSYRAEKSRTRRHLSEYNHVEAELDFITFEELLDHIEDMMVTVSKLVLEMEGSPLLDVNPNYKPLEKPFYRIEYRDAIKFLDEHKIYKAEGGKYEFGDDIPEAAERRMTDIINKPIMLIRFPVELKAFYMAKCHDDPKVTESVDILIPGVGEIVGGSMRIWNNKELLAGYARENLDPSPYYWYTDMRSFGSSPHGGYGLGLERFLTWMCNKEHIKDVCLYPRYIGRCKP